MNLNTLTTLSFNKVGLFKHIVLDWKICIISILKIKKEALFLIDPIVGEDISGIIFYLNIKHIFLWDQALTKSIQRGPAMI